MNKYSVMVKYTMTLVRFIEVEAEDRMDAETQAESIAEGMLWHNDPTLADGVEEDRESFSAEVDELLEGSEPDEE